MVAQEPKPIRIQRRRMRGAYMQDAAGNGLPVVYVGRPSKWGNPWTPELYWRGGYSGDLSTATRHCVDAYRAWLQHEWHYLHRFPLRDVPDLGPLRNCNLACWCGPLDCCHADVLLELANQVQP